MARLYRLTMTEDHLRALLKATEFYERISMGQFIEILDTVDPHLKQSIEGRDIAASFLRIARQHLMPGLTSDNAFYSIRSPEIHDDNRICYDFQQVVRHRLSWDKNPAGGWTVNFDKPWRTSEKVDLIQIEAVEVEP